MDVNCWDRQNVHGNFYSEISFKVTTWLKNDIMMQLRMIDCEAVTASGTFPMV
jgi:hypothetical protein